MIIYDNKLDIWQSLLGQCGLKRSKTVIHYFVSYQLWRKSIFSLLKTAKLQFIPPLYNKAFTFTLLVDCKRSRLWTPQKWHYQNKFYYILIWGYPVKISHYILNFRGYFFMFLKKQLYMKNIHSIVNSASL